MARALCLLKNANRIEHCTGRCHMHIREQAMHPSSGLPALCQNNVHKPEERCCTRREAPSIPLAIGNEKPGSSIDHTKLCRGACTYRKQQTMSLAHQIRVRD